MGGPYSGWWSLYYAVFIYAERALMFARCASATAVAAAIVVLVHNKPRGSSSALQ